MAKAIEMRWIRVFGDLGAAMVFSRIGSNHQNPQINEDTPSKYIPRTYGSKLQLPLPPDTSKLLNKQEITRVQQVVGCLLFYALAVDPTMLVAISDLAAAQSKSTENTNAALTKLLNYTASHPDAKLEFHASDMILHIDSDASYLSVP